MGRFGAWTLLLFVFVISSCSDDARLPTSDPEHLNGEISDQHVKSVLSEWLFEIDLKLAESNPRIRPSIPATEKWTVEAQTGGTWRVAVGNATYTVFPDDTEPILLAVATPTPRPTAAPVETPTVVVIEPTATPRPSTPTPTAIPIQRDQAVKLKKIEWATKSQRDCQLVQSWDGGVSRQLGKGTLATVTAILPNCGTHGFSRVQLSDGTEWWTTTESIEGVIQPTNEDFEALFHSGRHVVVGGNSSISVQMFSTEPSCDSINEGETGTGDRSVLEPMTPGRLAEITNLLPDCGVSGWYRINLADDSHWWVDGRFLTPVNLE